MNHPSTKLVPYLSPPLYCIFQTLSIKVQLLAPNDRTVSNWSNFLENENDLVSVSFQQIRISFVLLFEGLLLNLSLVLFEEMCLKGSLILFEEMFLTVSV